MSERVYFFFVGLAILLGLYIEIEYIVYGVAALLAFEGLTDLRITNALQRARKVTLNSGLVLFHSKQRISIEAFRAWRVLVATVLVTAFVLIDYYGFETLWFFPWFMGFAILGAGASGVCPVVLMLRWAGFK